MKSIHKNVVAENVRNHRDSSNRNYTLANDPLFLVGQPTMDVVRYLISHEWRSYCEVSSENAKRASMLVLGFIEPIERVSHEGSMYEAEIGFSIVRRFPLRPSSGLHRAYDVETYGERKFRVKVFRNSDGTFYIPPYERVEEIAPALSLVSSEVAESILEWVVETITIMGNHWNIPMEIVQSRESGSLPYGVCRKVGEAMKLVRELHSN